MAGDVVIHGDADADALSQMQKFKFSSHDPPLDSIFASASATSNSFLGPRTMVSFGGVGGVKRSGSSFFGSHEQEDISDEYLDEYLNKQEKKRRLSVEQVQFLEKKFETENKLDPERKIQLAKELDLKPRQIAIWFQNRRARWKTKQLETDYETLHANYQSLKTNFTNILKENEKLKAEVLHLKHSGSSEKIMKANFEFFDNEEQPSDAMPTQATGYMISESVEYEMSAVAFKNDERISAKSNVTDADSPCLTDGIHSSLLKSGPSHVFELNHSDLSRNREDNLDDEFAKIDEAYVHMHSSSCNHGFPVEDQAFSFWSY